jgi:hypothetical protein
MVDTGEGYLSGVVAGAIATVILKDLMSCHGRHRWRHYRAANGVEASSGVTGRSWRATDPIPGQPTYYSVGTIRGRNGYVRRRHEYIPRMLD